MLYKMYLQYLAYIRYNEEVLGDREMLEYLKHQLEEAQKEEKQRVRKKGK